MRISDWRSDVCSSDLLEGGKISRLELSEPDPRWPQRIDLPVRDAVPAVVADVHARASDEQSHKACEALVIDARRRGIPGLVPDLAVASNRHVQGERPDGDAIFFNDKLQIGRASCRERVCQYV